MSEQMEEFKTNNKVHSRSLYLQFQGAKVGNKETGEACDGDYNINGDISRFKDGLLHGGTGIDGDSQPAIELANGHTEWWEEGQLHRENGPAVIAMHGTWEEYWLHGDMVMIRVYGSVEINQIQL